MLISLPKFAKFGDDPDFKNKILNYDILAYAWKNVQSPFNMIFEISFQINVPFHLILPESIDVLL